MSSSTYVADTDTAPDVAWIHLGFRRRRALRIASYFTPDTTRRCESIIPLACHQTGQRAAYSQRAASEFKHANIFNRKAYTQLMMQVKHYQRVPCQTGEGSRLN